MARWVRLGWQSWDRRCSMGQWRRPRVHPDGPDLEGHQHPFRNARAGSEGENVDSDFAGKAIGMGGMGGIGGMGHGRRAPDRLVRRHRLGSTDQSRRAVHLGPIHRDLDAFASADVKLRDDAGSASNGWSIGSATDHPGRGRHLPRPATRPARCRYRVHRSCVRRHLRHAESPPRRIYVPSPSRPTSRNLFTDPLTQITSDRGFVLLARCNRRPS